MARYKFVDMSPRLLPVVLESQLIPGSFAHAVHHLVDALDLSAFDAHFRNDDNGASAHAPAMLLKAVLLGVDLLADFQASESACRDCALRAQCLRKPDTTKTRQVAVLTRRSSDTHTQNMRARIDSAR